jgi:hypothetical protein
MEEDSDSDEVSENSVTGGACGHHRAGAMKLRRILDFPYGEDESSFWRKKLGLFVIINGRLLEQREWRDTSLVEEEEKITFSAKWGRKDSKPFHMHPQPMGLNRPSLVAFKPGLFLWPKLPCQFCYIYPPCATLYTPAHDFAIIKSQKNIPISLL